jgi:hypothetical protein
MSRLNSGISPPGSLRSPPSPRGEGSHHRCRRQFSLAGKRSSGTSRRVGWVDRKRNPTSIRASDGLSPCETHRRSRPKDGVASAFALTRFSGLEPAVARVASGGGSLAYGGREGDWFRSTRPVPLPRGLELWDPHIRPCTGRVCGCQAARRWRGTHSPWVSTQISEKYQNSRTAARCPPARGGLGYRHRTRPTWVHVLPTPQRRGVNRAARRVI